MNMLLFILISALQLPEKKSETQFSGFYQSLGKNKILPQWSLPKKNRAHQLKKYIAKVHPR